jgi:glycosyltransferase involved in cell wall biosynthesis
VILPTINLWGGVKRFLELGNIFIDRGHSFTVATPEGTPPRWFPFRGKVVALADLPSLRFDALFITEHCFLDLLTAAQSRLRIFYHVSQKEDLRPVLRHSDVEVFVNSTNLHEHDRRRFRITLFQAIGGVNLTAFQPKAARELSNPITVLTYGRLVRFHKGTRFVVRACERLYKQGINLKLILFDTPLDERGRQLIKEFTCKLPFEFVVDHPVTENNALFQRADIFASAEKIAGWANTSAEAMAAGLPVIGTRSGSRDFLIHNRTGLVIRRNSFSIGWAIKRLIRDNALRQRLAAAGRARIEQFGWERLATVILDHLQQRLQERA